MKDREMTAASEPQKAAGVLVELKRMVICFFIVFLATGCEAMSTVERSMNKMAKPVYLVGISPEGDVLLRDADGKVLQLSRTYYMAKSIVGSGVQPGEILIPAVHYK